MSRAFVGTVSVWLLVLMTVSFGLAGPTFEPLEELRNANPRGRTVLSGS